MRTSEDKTALWAASLLLGAIGLWLLYCALWITGQIGV